VIGSGQKTKTFWDRVQQHYNKKSTSNMCENRHARNLETKLGLIKHNISKFVGCIHRSLVALNEFGTFAEDTLQKALKFYENKLPKQ
jgi:hypothetical protein